MSFWPLILSLLGAFLIVLIINGFRSQTVRNLGNTEPICPYCDCRLEKMPGRKKRCPGCGRSIFVRTHPTSKEKILVREDMLEEVDEQWSIVNGMHDDFIAERDAYEQERARLQKKFGREPLKGDVKWGLLQNELLDHAKHNHWGLYRNTRLEMGKILKAEGRNLPALDTYLEVCYLDLNGPTNYGVAGPERIEFDEDDSLLIAPFNPDEGQLFDGVVRMVFDVVTEEQLSLKDLEARFLKVASTTQRQRKLSVIPDDAWRALNADFDWD